MNLAECILLKYLLFSAHIILFRNGYRGGAGIRQWHSAGLRTGRSGVRVPAGAGNVSLHHRVQTGSGTHPVSYPMDTKGSSLGVRRLGREADHLPPSSAEVKNA
jgi:hypothetical protein